MRINPKYQYKTTPRAKNEAIVAGDKYRFTILTPRLFRIEYSETGIFEDGATQTVINRDFELPKFEVSETEKLLRITTEVIEITYTKEPLSSNSLSVCYINSQDRDCDKRISAIWHFKTKDTLNLKATTRTLDGVDGECELENGIMSRSEVTVFDDSKSLIIADDGIIEERITTEEDYYIFCYGKSGENNTRVFDYSECLKAFYKLTGDVPLLPRYSLGNWWSRYYKYTADEYLELMRRFKSEEIPFSVAVIDMDWHYVRIDAKYGTGWTGYSWNRELFPDYKTFLKDLKAENMRVSLNLHPADGVAAHEDAYEEMAKAMGIDPKTEEKVDFDITNPKFAENYFSILHHPLERDGIDFWWMDWQHGTVCRIPGLDPLWMLNHYHTLDHQTPDRRPLMLSRYSGPGSHRYPVGFSGDTIMSWESLDFQPYFTATASNIGYVWWSHDIGGHGCGCRDDELTARWVQFGVFSPITRLHSTNNPFMGKEPWNFNKICEASVKKFLKLRHKLIPYLYTMNYRAHKYGEPLVQPLYYKWNNNDTYYFKNEYCFGTEMIVSPITGPHDTETMMGSVDTYLPKGIWYDFFTNNRYRGDRSLKIFRDIYEMPVFVKAGGIIPLAEQTGVNDVFNPESLRIKVYPGDSGNFEMYEDDSETMAFEDGHYVTTKFVFTWKDKPEFIIQKPSGDTSLIPEKRNYTVEFIGIENTRNIIVTEDSEDREFEIIPCDNAVCISITDVTGEITIKFGENVKTKKNNTDAMLFKLLNTSGLPNMEKADFYKKVISEKSTFKKLSALTSHDFGDNITKALIEIYSSDEE